MFKGTNIFIVPQALSVRAHVAFFQAVRSRWSDPQSGCSAQLIPLKHKNLVSEHQWLHSTISIPLLVSALLSQVTYLHWSNLHCANNSVNIRTFGLKAPMSPSDHKQPSARIHVVLAQAVHSYWSNL